MKISFTHVSEYHATIENCPLTGRIFGFEQVARRAKVKIKKDSGFWCCEIKIFNLDNTLNVEITNYLSRYDFRSKKEAESYIYDLLENTREIY